MSTRSTGTARSIPEFEAFYRRHEREVRAFVRRRARDHHVAEDVIAETWIAAAQAIGRNGVERYSVGWLMTVARRRLHDHWRAQERRRRLTARLREQEVISAALHSTTGPASSIVSLLDELPPAQRAALWAKYVDGEPVTRVAEELGVTYVAAESTLARGRRSLATALEAVGIAS